MAGVGMRSIQVELETVTPLFLSGADQQVAELRAPSFRGALRYWLRALLGVGRTSAETFVEESKVFGDTSRGSAISLRLAPPVLTAKSWSNLGSSSGADYLWFSMKQKQRPAILSNQRFTLILNSRANDNSTIQQAMGALWLLCNLGGIGARERRCAGSLRIISSTIQMLPACFVSQATTPTKLCDEIRSGVQELQKTINPSEPDVQQPVFDILHPNFCHIYIPDKTWMRANEAVDAVGSAYKLFRSNHPDESYDVARTLFDHQPLNVSPPRAGLGLPIQYFYKGRPPGERKGTLEGKSSEGDKIDRRASPLHLRISRLANGRYATIWTWFDSTFLPEGSQVSLRPEKRTMGTDTANTPTSLIVEQAVRAMVSAMSSTLLEVAL